MNKNKPHQDLLLAQKLLYSASNLQLSNLNIEPESVEYGACNFNLNAHKIVFRTAKITPTKVGQFVTIWKRSSEGPIIPYDFLDHIDYYIISVRENSKLGQFIFPKSALLKHGVLSNNKIGGKRAMRVYAPWHKPTNKQALRTQSWQHHYFYEISENKISELNLKNS